MEEDVAKTPDAISNIIQGIQSDSFENRFIRKDGSITHMQWTAHWSTEEGILFCVARDTTEKKNLEAQFLRAQRMESIGNLAVNARYAMPRGGALSISASNLMLDEH